MRNDRVQPLLLLFLGVTACQQAHATVPTIAFWASHLGKLKFTTSAQSIYQSNCSGTATIQTLNYLGVATNVSSTLTVNLAGTNLTFYSDPDCTSAVTSITVSSGTNNSSFYFVAGATGTLPITASATAYKSVSQSETISTNPFVWTGGGGNANWSTAANWSGGAAPGASNVAIFNGTCSSNCSPNITANMSVGGVRMDSTYSGTITQNSGVTLTIGSSGWIQSAGSFAGSSSGDAITDNGSWALLGGAYTATSGTWQVNGTLFKVSGSPTFAHNGGMLQFNQPWSTVTSIIPGSVTYKNVKFSGSETNNDLGGGSMTIAGDLTLANVSGPGYGKLSNGTILLSGNLNMPSSSYGQSSGMTIKLVGNASGQTVTGDPTSSLRADLVIDTGSNPVTFSGTVNLYNSNFTVTTVGTFTATGSTFIFNAANGSKTISAGSAMLNHVQFTQGANGPTANISGTLNVGGTLTFNGQNYINGGTINAYGDIVTGNYVYSGSATIVVAGNAAGQTISGNGSSSANLPNVTIAAGANNVTLSGSIYFGRSFTYTSGNLVTTGSTLMFNSDCIPLTISPGSATYNNVQFVSKSCTYLHETVSGTFNIGGNLTFNTFHLIDGGTLAVAGNVTITEIYGGTAAMTFNGSSAQSVTQSGGTFPSGVITVNNPSGITLASNVIWNGSTQTTTVTSGSINMSGYNLTLHALSLNGNTVTKGGGTLSVATGTSPYGGTVNP
ncbi:MAG: beta strand repeat-containing protein [Bdellovibrionia bacterium]